jgi:hypothetical protein
VTAVTALLAGAAGYTLAGGALTLLGVLFGAAIASSTHKKGDRP